MPILEKLFKACLAKGFVPAKWRLARVVFLTKPGRTQYVTTSDFRSISLTSFLLKTLKRLIDRHIKEECLVKAPLHTGQHAYQAGKSVDTALAEVIGYIKDGMRNRGIALAAFLDVDGAFNHTTRAAMAQGMRENAISHTVFRWIWDMLSNRKIEAQWINCTRIGKVNKRCPQGGVLSLTLWCLVVDGLIRVLNDAEVYAQAYADDIVILVKRDSEEVLAGVMRFALGLVEK